MVFNEVAQYWLSSCTTDVSYPSTLGAFINHPFSLVLISVALCFTPVFCAFSYRVANLQVGCIAHFQTTELRSPGENEMLWRMESRAVASEAEASPLFYKSPYQMPLIIKLRLKFKLRPPDVPECPSQKNFLATGLVESMALYPIVVPSLPKPHHPHT